MGQEGKKLMLKFAKDGIESGKMNHYFKPRQTDHIMELREPDAYRTTKVHTERFKNSSIPCMQRLLNADARQK